MNLSSVVVILLTIAIAIVCISLINISSIVIDLIIKRILK